MRGVTEMNEGIDCPQDIYFNTWLDELDELSETSHIWITQIAHELAIGVTHGFWTTFIAGHMMIGWRPHSVGEPRGALEKYANNREKSAIFNNLDVEYNKFGVIVESLVLAGFLERTRLSTNNTAWLTPKAFELLKNPQHMETGYDKKTKV